MLVQTIEFRADPRSALRRMSDLSAARLDEVHGLLQYCFVVEVDRGGVPMYEVRAIWLRAAGPLKTGERLVKHAVHVS